MTLTKRRIGKLAQARRPRGPLIKESPLFWQAIDAQPGWTYPSMGAQLVLFGGAKVGMSREVQVAKTGANKLIMLLKKQEGK